VLCLNAVVVLPLFGVFFSVIHVVGVVGFGVVRLRGAQYNVIVIFVAAALDVDFVVSHFVMVGVVIYVCGERGYDILCVVVAVVVVIMCVVYVGVSVVDVDVDVDVILRRWLLCC